MYEAQFKPHIALYWCRLTRIAYCRGETVKRCWLNDWRHDIDLVFCHFVVGLIIPSVSARGLGASHARHNANLGNVSSCR